MFFVSPLSPASTKSLYEGAVSLLLQSDYSPRPLHIVLPISLSEIHANITNDRRAHKHFHFYHGCPVLVLFHFFPSFRASNSVYGTKA